MMDAVDGRVDAVFVVDAPVERAGRVAASLTALAAAHGGRVRPPAGSTLVVTFDRFSAAMQATATYVQSPEAAGMRCALVPMAAGVDGALTAAIAQGQAMCQAALPGQLVVAARDAAASTPDRDRLDALVGRDAELATLRNALDAAASERPQVVTLAGELGSGRSALLAAARDLARARGFAVLDAAGADGLIGGRWSSLRASLLWTPAADGQRHGAEWLPSLAADDMPDEPTVARELLAQLAQLTDEWPVLVTIDDVDRLDDASAAALRSAASGLAVERCLVLGAGPDSPDQWLGGAVVRLRELASDAVEQIVARDGLIDPTVLRRCVQLARGNALAACEISRSLSPRQRSGADPLPPVPEPAAAVLGGFRELLARATESARRAAVVAAADDTGDPDVVRAALVELAEDPGGLEEAEDAGLLQLDASGLRFTHPLLRSVAYHQVAARSRRAAHQALAVALDRPRQAKERAYQLAAAAVGPSETASDALALVAEAELRRGDAPAAARACANAARLTPDETLREQRFGRAALLYLGCGELASVDDVLRGLAQPTNVADAVLARCLADLARVGPARARANLDRSAVAPALLSITTALEHYLDGLAGVPVADSAEPLAAVGRVVAGAAPASNLLDLEFSSGPLGTLEASLSAHELAVAGWPNEAGAILRRLDGQPDAIDRVVMQATAGRLALDAGRIVAALEILGDAEASARCDSPSDALRLLALARARLYCGRLDDAEVALDAVRTGLDRLGLAVHEAEADLVGGLILHARGHDGGAKLLATAARKRPDRAVPELVVATLDRHGAPRPEWTARLRTLLDSPDRRVALSARRALAALSNDLEELSSVAKQQEEAGLHLEAELSRDVTVSTSLRVGSAGAPQRRDDGGRAGKYRGIVYPGSVYWKESRSRASILDKLSPAEHRVAVAVSTGATNKEASAQLFISVKTVDYHLQNIYRKLGARSRTELAVLLAGSTERGSGA